MYTRKKITVLIITLFFATFGFGLHAQAFDAGTFLKQLEDTARENGNEFSYESLEDSADGSFTLKNVEIVDRGEKYTIQIDTLAFSNASQISPDGMQFDRLQAFNFTQSGIGDDGEDVTITAAMMKAENFNLPNLGDQDNPLWPANVESLEIFDVTITSKNAAEDVSLNSPGLVLEGLAAKTGTNFLLESFVMEPATGAIFHEGNKIDIGFDGLRMRGVEHFGQAGLEAEWIELGSLQTKGITEKGQVFDFSFGGLVADNLYIADPSVDDRPLLSEKPMTMQINELTAQIDGKDFLGWDGGSASYTYDPATKTGTGKGKFSNSYVDFSAAPLEPEDRKNLEQLKALGYERIAMNLEGTGSWNIETGALKMDKYRLDFVDAGAIELNMHLSGYTEEVARNFTKIANQVSQETDPKTLELKNMQMLAALTSLSINSLKISVEDNSLLNKVLELQAAQLKQEPQQLTQMVGPMASIMLAPYNVPEFAATLSAALGTFMQGNKTITMSAEPTNGLVVTEIISLVSGVQAGQTTPAEVINRLNLKVEAR